MEVEFAFRREESKIFGSIYRPVAKVTLVHRNHHVPEIFYVDSGADLTVIPLSIGQILSFENPKPEEIIEIKGIGEKGIPIVVRKVTMIFAATHMRVRIAWALIENVPLLLGREDFFSSYNITFVKNKKTIFQSEFFRKRERG